MEEFKKRDKGKSLHPLCGKRYPSDTHEWTPALIRSHEAGCADCQSRKEASNQDRTGRIRDRLNQFYDDHAPFEEED